MMRSKCGCGHAESPEDNDSTWYVHTSITKSNTNFVKARYQFQSCFFHHFSDSCSDCAVESRYQAYSHFSRSPSRGQGGHDGHGAHGDHGSRSMRSGSSGRRRHRSVSPRSKKLEDAIVAAAANSHSGSRSRSAGHLIRGTVTGECTYTVSDIERVERFLTTRFSEISPG